MPSPRRRVPTAALAPAALLSLALALGACGGGTGGGGGGGRDTAPPPGLVRPDGRENVAVYYQRIDPGTDLRKLGRVQAVIAGQQNGAEAARAIKATGAKAYRYVQTYWFPVGRAYDGLDIGAHPTWAYCRTGRAPLVGRTTGRRAWWFVDMNERAVHDHFAARLAQLKAERWDGVFFDRGYASMTGYDTEMAGVWNHASTCTEDPVERGATFADAYVGMTAEVARAGLELVVNYGVSPFDARTPMRPDPRSTACAARDFAKCPRLDDAWEHATRVLDEAVAHARDLEWENDFRSNHLNEQDETHGRKVIGLITEGTLGGSRERSDVFFEWSRVKLFAVPLAVNTGDDGCPGAPEDAVCNRSALYPELANIVFGPPVATAPRATECSKGSRIRCVWSRPYEWGMSVVNVRPDATHVTLPLETEGCRYVRDVWSGKPLAGNRCVERVDLDLPAWGGRPLEYGTRPF